MHVALLLCLLVDASGSGHAAQIVGAALVERGSVTFTRELSDGIGARASGSKGAEAAVIWAEAAMKRVGLSKVRREPVEVRHWVRGPIAATLRADAAIAGSIDQPLTVIALGGSVATPPAGIEAKVVEANSLEEIAALRLRGRGTIVFVNREMSATGDWSGYGPVASLRRAGPAAAAKIGAKAFLIRSAGTGRHGLPHTGATRYEEGGTAIPAAALSAEDADLLHRRLSGKHEVKVLLKLESEERGKAPSFNVVGELPGTGRGDLKNEIVLIGAHLDSWDVGRGALDDAAGCGMALDTARVLGKLPVGPARTIRVVLFMSEEIDGAGAQAYANSHKNEIPRHVAAMEADSGDGRPLHYGVVAGGDNLTLVKKWVEPIAGLVPAEVRAIESGGADVAPLLRAGVPVLELGQDHRTYFDWHHTVGDTFDKVDPASLALATAAFAHLTWQIANAPDRLVRAQIAP